MPDRQLYTREAAIAKATLVKAGYATSKLRLFQAPFAPTPATTKAQLVAAEANFDGYTSGGYAIAAFTGPNNFPGGGQVLTSPLIDITYGPAGTPPKGNDISGWWIEDATGTVLIVGIYDPVRSLQVLGDVINWIAQDVEGLVAPATNPS